MPRATVPCERSSDPCKHRQALGKPLPACCSLTTASLTNNPAASTYCRFAAAVSLPPANCSSPHGGSCHSKSKSKGSCPPAGSRACTAAPGAWAQLRRRRSCIFLPGHGAPCSPLLSTLSLVLRRRVPCTRWLASRRWVAVLSVLDSQPFQELRYIVHDIKDPRVRTFAEWVSTAGKRTSIQRASVRQISGHPNVKLAGVISSLKICTSKDRESTMTKMLGAMPADPP